MMHTIRTHAFSIVFYTLSLAFILFLLTPRPDEKVEQLLTASITVEQNATVEQVAEVYNDGSMTDQEYVEWLIENNELKTTHVISKNKIVVPIAQQ
ncbi:hypothetical protein [Exiguobacterium sp. s166]|uniref:cell division suppressor protein YneA n=1 Tax=Exiguobacterium sp. s166 TaxID=2751204 RepID=UPI001BE749FE|nr:hypothetical protein [Exiguobacterium sp. s166]